MASLQQLSEVRDGMRIDWNVPITMDDGLVLRADVFRPVKDGQYPVILTYGPYAKNLAFQDGYPSAWQRMAEKHPDVAAGSSNLYQSWEVVDPEKWVPHDYACVRVDSRGAGCSPGVIDHFSPRETKDFYDCIEWAGVQPWSNGKVGLNGISYYGINQWHVASLQPPHLAAMCVWEGCGRLVPRHDASRRHSLDVLGELVRHAGQDRAIRRRRARQAQPRARRTGVRAGNADRRTARQEPLRFRRRDRSRIRWTTTITAPFAGLGEGRRRRLFTAANWGGQGLHPRGNFEGFVRAASKQKWLEAHGIEHWTHFYTDYGREQQLRFFDYFLHGKKDGWAKQPKVLLQVRHPGREIRRARRERMADRAHAMDQVLSRSRISMALRSQEAVRQRQALLRRHGRRPHFPDAARSSTKPKSPARRRSSCSPRRRPSDADFFIVLRVFTGDLKEVVFQGAIDPHTPIAQGWLRASHRKLDKKLSTALPALSHPRREAAARQRQAGRTRHRDLADLDRGSGRLSRRPVDPRQGLRIWRRQRRQAVELQERTHRLRPVPAQRSAATARPRFSTAPPRCISAGGKAPYLLLPIIPPKKQAAGEKARGANKATLRRLAAACPRSHAN